MFKQLEQRRSQLVFAEKKIVAFEGRINELKQLTDHIDKQIESVSGRQTVVAAVKAEVENVHQIGARSKADLQYVAEHRADVAALKNSVDEVLSHIGQTEEKMSTILSRKKMVDEIEVKTQMITNLLADVRVNLETLGEHKSQVDHLSEKLARLDFMTQALKGVPVDEPVAPEGVVSVNGEWFYEEYTQASGAGTIVAEPPANAPTESERRSILDLFKH